MRSEYQCPSGTSFVRLTFIMAPNLPSVLIFETCRHLFKCANWPLIFSGLYSFPMRSRKRVYISFDFSEPYTRLDGVRCAGGHSRAIRTAYHSAVEIRFIAFVRVGEKRELRDAEDVSVYILHILPPH